MKCHDVFDAGFWQRTALGLVAIGVFALLFLMSPWVALGQDVPPDPSIIGDSIAIVADNWSVYGWLGGLAGLLTVAVQVFRAIMPARWSKLPKWGRLLIVFVLAGVGAGLLVVAGGASVAAAIGAGITAGLAAIGTNQVGKAVKEAKQPKETPVADPTPGPESP